MPWTPIAEINFAISLLKDRRRSQGYCDISSGIVPNQIVLNLSMTDVEADYQGAPHHFPDQDRSQGTTPLLWRQVVPSLVASMASLSFGIMQGYSSPTVAAIVSDGIITQQQVSWFASIAILGVAIGGLSAGVIVNAFGRKKCLLLICGLFAIGWAMITAANGVILLCTGRILTGIASGLTAVCVPTYISEISSKHIRGTLVSVMALIIYGALALTFGLGIILPWRPLAVCGCFVPAIQIFMMLAMPESPRWLLSKNRSREARDALQCLTPLRGPEFDITLEFTEMEISSTEISGSVSCETLRDPFIYKSILLIFGLMFIKQASGRAAVIFYASQIFESAGWSGNEHLPALIIALSQVGAVLVACVLVDRVGRRPLLVATMFSLTASCIALGTAFWLLEKENMTGIGWLSLTSLIVYIVSFGNGIGPLPPLIMVEIISTRMRGPVSGVAICLNWITAFLVTNQFITLLDKLGTYGTFWMFACVNLLGSIFTLIAVETVR